MNLPKNSFKHSKYPDSKHILIIESPQYKGAVSLKSSPFSVGRNTSNSLVLYSKDISRYHATLLWLKSSDCNTYSFWVIDGNLEGQRSRNGIFVNGKRCLFHQLKQGDTITFGSTVKAWYHILATTTATSEAETPSEPPVEEQIKRNKRERDSITLVETPLEEDALTGESIPDIAIS
jgi:pSer/pThr/pTyr-binding forkhead associated (FHA) protein